MKSKIDLSKIPEEIEAPSIINFREHYCPSVYYIIASHYCKRNQNNKRIPVIRSKRRMRVICNTDNNFYEGTIMYRKNKSGTGNMKNSCLKDETFSVSKFQWV